MARPKHRYAIEVDQLSPTAAAAAEAAESSGARTVICGEQGPLAAIVPWSEIARLEPPDPSMASTDPLLSLCGSCPQDVFVDGLSADFAKTMLFRRS